MIVNQLLKNRLVKIIGVCVILYFALFADKENPNSLGNKLSKERLVKGFNEAKEKSKFIMTNVNAAQDISKQKQAELKEEETVKKEVQPAAPVKEEKTKQPLVISPNRIVKCGDEVTVDYSIYKSDLKIHSVTNEKLTVGSKNNWLLEQSILGLKHGDVANINLLDQLKNIDEVALPRAAMEHNLHYRVTIHQITDGTVSNIEISCK